MKPITQIIILFGLTVLTFGPQAAWAQTDSAGEFIMLDEQNNPLRDDFNERVGTVRQLFIIGPTCGVCLRGMADLNAEYIAERQNDPRLHTYSVYVPALQATFEDAQAAVDLLTGPRIDNYWQESGQIGVDFQPVLDTEHYVWDVWFIYGPDAVWVGDTPPAPDFWQHQLSVFPRSNYLDRREFAAQALAMVDAIALPSQGTDEDVVVDAGEVVIPAVAQGFGVPLRQYREAMGGNSAIDQVVHRIYRGLLTVDNETVELEIRHDRPNVVTRHIGDDVTLPQDVLTAMDADFDFDTPLIHWRDKGHSFTVEGMRRLDNVLYWNLIQTDPDGQRRIYLVDTHSGTIRRIQWLGDDGRPRFSVRYSDFRDVQGMPLAHYVEVLGSDGEVLWIEEYDEIAIAQTLGE